MRKVNIYIHSTILTLSIIFSELTSLTNMRFGSKQGGRTAFLGTK